ncbi:unnamed protein product, partial [Tetraodon nigroviridis]
LVFFLRQGTQVKDVILKPDCLKTLLLDKHADYIASYGSKNDDYLPDLCYSWWVLASLKIIGKLHWIDKAKLRTFILACQDEETGGFADRPGDMVDPFHTLFGVAGLSLLGDEQIKPVNPVLCMPEDIVQRLNLKPELLS